MSPEDGDESPADATGAPVDADRLDPVAERLRGDGRFARVTREPEFAPRRVVCGFEDGFCPGTVAEARLGTRFENGDFSLHYHESHADGGAFDHRWDRHPSTHDARDHVHPGPDAPTPGEDADHPADWRDVLATALDEVQDRQRAFWTDG